MISNRWAMAGLVFVVTLGTLGLFSWDRAWTPSPHFHFVDLAHSFWAGRFDTDTPRRRVEQRDQTEDAPRGYFDAIERQTRNPDGSARGWNDWASYRVLSLKGGDSLRGVFPWRDTSDRKDEFHALNGDLYRIDCRREVRSGCHGNRPEHLKFYVSFPPFPAVLMMPLTRIWGYDLNDVWFTLFFGAMNASILFLLLESLRRRGHSERTRSDNLWLTCMFVFGTVHFFSSVRGEVWFTALIVGVTLNLLAIACAIDLKRPLLAGLFVGLGMATRTPLAFGATLILLLAVFPNGKFRREEWGRTIWRLTQFAIPTAVILGLLMVYNYTRFESLLEFGHSYLQEGARGPVREHGLMSGWFFGANLSAAFINPPVITFESWPYIRITKHGLGLIWTTPALLLLLGSPRRSALFWSLLATAAVVSLPGLFYQNTGWEQFGYRFGLDWLPFLVVAFAVGGRRINWPVKALILVGVLVNAFGAVTFGRMNGIYY